MQREIRTAIAATDFRLPVLWSAFNGFYRPQRSCGQGNVFTSVCLSTGGEGCLPQCMLGYPPDQTPPPDQAHTPRTRHTPPTRHTPRIRHTPPDQTPPPQTRHPPRTRHTPRPTRHTPPGSGTPPPRTRHTPGPGSRLQYTVYERPVRILLECILFCRNAFNNTFTAFHTQVIQ